MQNVFIIRMVNVVTTDRLCLKLLGIHSAPLLSKIAFVWFIFHLVHDKAHLSNDHRQKPKKPNEGAARAGLKWTWEVASIRWNGASWMAEVLRITGICWCGIIAKAVIVKAIRYLSLFVYLCVVCELSCWIWRLSIAFYPIIICQQQGNYVLVSVTETLARASDIPFSI